MHRPLSKLALASATAISASSAFAATPIGDYLNFSGFGTLGAVATSTDEAEFKQANQSAGANKGGSAIVDSDFAMQLTATATPWLSGTVQMLSIARGMPHLTNEFEWAYVKVKPMDGLTLRGGRMALPMFAVSDSRNVGYANNWLRAPGEVYALALFSGLRGGDVTYTAPIGSTTLTASAMAGKTGGDRSPERSQTLEGNQLRGLNLTWETEWATFRLGQIRTKVPLPGFVDSYKFTGAGVMVDRGNIVAQAEYVTRRSAKLPGVVNSDGWYVLGGYRFGQLLPYASYASSRPKVGGSPFYTSGPQHTTAIGLRWDAFKSADVKFQLERIDTQGTAGVSFTAPVNKPVTAASVAVDFVF
jgi:hypothetical protein